MGDKIFDQVCLDCKTNSIPDGHSGAVFLVCQDRAGEFVLCSGCFQRRRKEVEQSELDRRRRIIEIEERESNKKHKKSSRPGGGNRQGSQH